MANHILRQNKGLEKKVDELTTLTVRLLHDNEKRSKEIERLTLQLVGISNKVSGINRLLISQINGNNFLETDVNNSEDKLNNIRVLIKILLHYKESCERENEVLRRIIRKSKE